MPEQKIGAPGGMRFRSARADGSGAVITWEGSDAPAEPSTPPPAAGWKALGELPEWVGVEGASERRLTINTAGLMAVRISIEVGVPLELRGLEHEIYAIGFPGLGIGAVPVGAIHPPKRDPQLFLRTKHWRWAVGWMDSGHIAGWASVLAPAAAGMIGPAFAAQIAGQDRDIERWRLQVEWGVSMPAQLPQAMTVQVGEARKPRDEKTRLPIGWQFGVLSAWGLGR